MEEELREELGVKAELIPGRGGVFNVRLNGDLVFSKAEVGRFPEELEVVRAIRRGKASGQAKGTS